MFMTLLLKMMFINLRDVGKHGQVDCERGHGCKKLDKIRGNL